MWKDDFARAEPLLREARDRLRARLGADSPEVAQVTYNLAQSSLQRHRLPEAEALLREALAALRRAHGEESRHVIVTCLSHNCNLYQYGTLGLMRRWARSQK